MYHIIHNWTDHTEQHLKKNISLCGLSLDWQYDDFVSLKARPTLKSVELCLPCKVMALDIRTHEPKMKGWK